MNINNATKVKVQYDTTEYWNWCCDNAKGWLKKIGLMGTSATYFFTNAEDATAFRLVFNL